MPTNTTPVEVQSGIEFSVLITRNYEANSIDEFYRRLLATLAWDSLVRLRDADAKRGLASLTPWDVRFREHQEPSAANKNIDHQGAGCEMRLFETRPTRTENQATILPFLLKYIAVD